MENFWKVFSRIRWIRGKYLHEEYDEVRVLCGTQTLNPNMLKTFVIVGPKNPFPNKIGPNTLFKKLNTLLQLRTLNSVHMIGCRKTKLSIERNMFPVCGLQEYSWISVVCRYFRNYPNIFRRFLKIFRRFPKVFPVEIKRGVAVGGDRTHVLWITDLVFYLPATAAIWIKRIWNKIG